MIKVLQKVFLFEDQNIKSVKHMASYTNIASRMLLTITYDCPCYSMEQSTDRTRYTHCVALVMSRDLIDRDIWDIRHQPLQVLLDSLVIINSQSRFLNSFPTYLDGGCT